jgi:hypothetical protein
MPPPAFANKASELAPKLKPRTDVASPTANKIIVTPRRLVPTTAIPITATDKYISGKAKVLRGKEERTRKYSAGNIEFSKKIRQSFDKK